MTAIQLRAELFREMSPLLDSEAAMEKILTFVRTLVPAKKARAEAGWADKYVGTWKGTDNEMLDAALAEFSGDFGGSKDARDVARELRQGAEMVRDVKTW